MLLSQSLLELSMSDQRRVFTLFVEGLVGRLNDPDPGVVVAAERGLGRARQKNPDFHHYIKRLRRPQQNRVREHAVNIKAWSEDKAPRSRSAPRRQRGAAEQKPAPRAPSPTPALQQQQQKQRKQPLAESEQPQPQPQL